MSARKPPDEPRGKRGRIMTAEEVSLWRQVAATVDGKAKGKARVRNATKPSEFLPDVGERLSVSGPAADERVSSRGAPGRQRAAAVVAPRAPAAPRPAAKPPQLAEFDRRKVRHVASGKIEIDARLDLHGLRQGEARQRLSGFIRTAHERGHRMVLVITGKGSATPFDPLGAALGEPQRGVLRRLVPQWLDETGLRAFVISFTTATARHGGDGALYVRLRRADRV